MTDLHIRYAQHVGESSGHWYDHEHGIVESVPKADGKGTTKPTLRHARKHQWAPGNTTICGVADKPELLNWQITNAILIGAETPRHEHEDDLSWMMRCRDALSDLSRSEEGTRIHAALDQYWRGEIPDGYPEHIDGATRALAAACGPQHWRSEVPTISPHGYGTFADLLSDEWLIDVKTKDGDFAKMAGIVPYESYVMQLAATRDALKMPHLRCGNLFVSRTHPGDAVLVEVKEDRLRTGLHQFLAMLGFWQLRHNYRPEWATDSVWERLHKEAA